MRLVVIGAGYVGLVTGVGFAESGHRVTVVDVDTQRVAELSAGRVPFFEPGLAGLIARNVAAGRLDFGAAGVAGAEVAFVCVGTPSAADGSADVSAVLAAVDDVARLATDGLVLVLKSTVPVGTHAAVVARLSAGPRVHVVSNPEFLEQGNALSSFLRPDRIVIGCDLADGHAVATMRRLYHPMCLDRDRTLWMDPASAEVSKLAANAMLAVRVSFMNEVADLCDVVGADVHRVREAVGADGRIGPRYLYAGPGYGGSCLPKDVRALVHAGRQLGVPLGVAAAADAANEARRLTLVAKVDGLLGGLSGRRVAVWGASFKPRTDDLRASPAVSLIDGLLAGGASVTVHDPEARTALRLRYGARVHVCDDAYDAVEDADALVLMTEWREYQNPDFERVRRLLRGDVVFDTRNIWSRYGLGALGFTYVGLGVR